MKKSFQCGKNNYLKNHKGDIMDKESIFCPNGN